VARSASAVSGSASGKPGTKTRSAKREKTREQKSDQKRQVEDLQEGSTRGGSARESLSSDPSAVSGFEFDSMLLSSESAVHTRSLNSIRLLQYNCCRGTEHHHSSDVPLSSRISIKIF
jgi:hypothetical protein